MTKGGGGPYYLSMKQGRSFSLDFLIKFLFSRRAGAIIKIIAWLSIIGIGTGVASLIIVLSVMNGFNHSMRVKRFATEPHLVGYFEKKSVAEIEADAGYLWLQQRKGVKTDISESQDVLVKTTDGFIQGAIAQGISKNTLYYVVNQNRKTKGQAALSKENIDLAPGELLMGGGVGDVLGVFEGDQVVIVSPEAWLGPKEAVPALEKMKVKNFIRTEIDEIDSQKIFYIAGESLGRLRNTASLERQVEVRLPNPEKYEPYKKRLEGFGWRVDSWKERNSNLFYSLKLEKFVVGLLLGLSTMIASFSLVTVMTLLVTQKKKDIGLLLALGFPPLKLRKTFLQVGLMLASIGITGGLLFGLTASLFIGKYSQGLLPAIYEDTNIPTDIQAPQVIVVVLFSFVFAIFTTWVSVRKLSEMDPIQGLRG
jgi:lipoprotein-releasing system permease protein